MPANIIKEEKEEINTQISFEGHIIHAQESFHSRTPSEYFIEAIEPTTLVSITYDDLERIYAHSTRMEHLGRLIITYTMVIKDRWQMQVVMHTPRERFIHFVTSSFGNVTESSSKIPGFLSQYQTGNI